MEIHNKNKCPKCSSDSFITEPNQYQILKYIGEKFEEIKTEIIDKEDLRIFCRDCGSEIDEDESIIQGKIIFKVQDNGKPYYNSKKV
jgi:DNA-directed RNA polymerase subunit RPC12/RpoP